MRWYKIIILTLIATTTLPFFVLLTSIDFSLFSIAPELFWVHVAQIIGSVTGFIGIMLCFWTTVLGVRVVNRLFSEDLLWFNRIHQLIGIYGGAFVLVHPLLEAYAYGESLLFLALPSFETEFATHISFGRIAFISFFIIWITSAVVRGKIKYRPWLYIHYLSYAVVIFAVLHIREIGTVLASHEWLRGLLTTLLPLSVIMLAARMLYACGFFQYRYRVTVVQKNAQTILFGVTPIGKRLVPSAGQFCYMQLKRCGEAHPFSVMDYDEKTGMLTFGVKAFGSFSTAVSGLCEGQEIFLDGPYGVFCAEGRNPSAKILIAGGIGVTPLFHLVQKHATDDTYMVHCNRTRAEAMGREVLRAKLGDRYLDVCSDEQVPEQGMVCGRLTSDVIRAHVPAEILRTAPIFFCGNPGFYAATRAMLIEIGVPAEHIYFEAFSL